MTPDEPQPSKPSPASSAGEPPESAAAAEGLEEPRLGIRHFLVWTACVAVYMGCTRMLFGAIRSPDLPSQEIDIPSAVRGAIIGVGSGTALAGLVLLVARRLRGLAFPKYPGEYLLVVSGLVQGMQLVSMSLSWLLFAPGRPLDLGWTPSLGVLFALGFLALNVAVYLWAVVRVKERLWRIYLLAAMAEYFAVPLLFMMMRPAVGHSAHQFTQIAVGGILLAAACIDHFQGKRYPWTHWLGVALHLWFAATALAYWILNVLT